MLQMPPTPAALNQFVDAVQGPTNQAQGPTVQNQAQGPTDQNQAQGPAVQIPVQGPAQIGQNALIQPPQQPAPVQLVPAGIVVPTPQIIY